MKNDNEINWQFFPQTAKIPDRLEAIIKCFKSVQQTIDSKTHELKSNDVLKEVKPFLEKLNIKIENKKGDLTIPVLYGLNGKPIVKYAVDGYDELSKTIIEVEAGRALANNQFLKDLFESCLMIDIDYCVIAVRLSYTSNNKKSNTGTNTTYDFEKITTFVDAIYSGNRLFLPLKGVLIIGY